MLWLMEQVHQMFMLLPKKGSIHQIQLILHIVKAESSCKTWSTLLIQLAALSALTEFQSKRTLSNPNPNG